MDDRNGTIDRMDRPKDGQDYCVIPPKRDDTRVVFTVQGDRGKTLTGDRVVS